MMTMSIEQICFTLKLLMSAVTDCLNIVKNLGWNIMKRLDWDQKLYSIKTSRVFCVII